MTSPYSIYIPIGITYKDYKAEYFAAYIDSSLGTCLCKADCFPKKYHQKLAPIKGRDISNQLIEIDKGIEKPIILLGQFLIKCPPFYFYTTGTDVLLGNNFLQLFTKIIFDTTLHQITFHTPCQHIIIVKRFKKAYAKCLPILFQLRTAQRGDLGYTATPIFPKGTLLLQYQLLFKQLDIKIDSIKIKLAKCFSTNPLQFWDKNKIEAKLEMKDTNK